MNEKDLREKLNALLGEDLIEFNSTHEHAPPGKSCEDDCGVRNQGHRELALMRSGGEKHRKCMECWEEYIGRLMGKIMKVIGEYRR